MFFRILEAEKALTVQHMAEIFRNSGEKVKPYIEQVWQVTLQ